MLSVTSSKNITTLFIFNLANLLDSASFESSSSRPASMKSQAEIFENATATATRGGGGGGGAAINPFDDKDEVLYKVVALYANVPGDVDELSFEKGETIDVLWLLEEEWWKGRNSRGQIGVFPSNYVKKI